MQNSEFAVKVEMILDSIINDIEDQDPEGEISIDLNYGILTLVTNSGTFIVNKQSSTQEIWLSSPISGPHHFSCIHDSWKSQSGSELFEILTNELGIKFLR